MTLAPRPPARARTLACPNCGGSIEVRASGISITAICASCGATIDIASPELKIIAAARERTREPAIPIGRRGTLFGTEWEVIGYQTRSDSAEGSWDEYLLFNPYRGFRFLAKDSEGWSLFCMLRHDVQPPGQPESQSEAVTDYVLGEFYWRARVGDRASVSTYIAGSQILLQERTGDEVVWSRGTALPEKVVQPAFNIAVPTVSRTAHRAPTVQVLRVAVVAFVVLCLLDIVPFGRSRSLPVFQQAFTTGAADRGRTLATEPFTVPDASGNLQIQVHAPVQDDWFEVGLALVRQPDDLTFTARPTIEYYSGSDSDGSWEEGSQSARVVFTNVPGGSYRLLLDTDAGAYARQPSANLIASMRQAKNLPPDAPDPTLISFDVTVRRHVPAQEFFWIALALLAPYPLYRLFFRRGSA